MKNLTLVLFLCLLVIIGCKRNGSSKSETLYVEKTSADETSGKDVTVKTVMAISTDYFEVSLEAQTTGGYLAQQTLEQSRPGEPFKWIFITVANKDGSPIKFMTSTDFLNFMSAHGYEMVTQIPNQYGGDYTFKRKK